MVVAAPIFGGLIVVAFLVFAAVLGFISWQTERYLDRREKDGRGFQGRHSANGRPIG